MVYENDLTVVSGLDEPSFGSDDEAGGTAFSVVYIRPDGIKASENAFSGKGGCLCKLNDAKQHSDRGQTGLYHDSWILMRLLERHERTEFL